MRGPITKRDTLRSLVFILVAVVFKMVLTNEIRIVPAFGPADASNFLEHARTIAEGRWFGAYDNMTLVKQPFFPIYLAIVEQLGISLPVAHVLFDALACSVACLAIRPLIRSDAVLAAIFLLLYFNPFSYDTLAWVTYRSQINPGLALVSLSCAFAILIRRRRPFRFVIPWIVGLGASFSAFWLTREEAIWLAPALAICIGTYLVLAYREQRSGLPKYALAVIIPGAMVVVSVAAVMITNGVAYGWFITNEQQSPEFISAYNSLARITVPYQPYFPVPRAAREIAYSVSPDAKALEPALEGPLGAAWHDNACSALPQACSIPDIGGGWFQWALRDAAAAAGHYTSGGDARAFYRDLSLQIDAACDARRIACGPKGRTVFPPVRIADAGQIYENFLLGMRNLLDVSTLTVEPWLSWPPSRALRSDYDFVVRSVGDDLQPQNLEGG